MRRVAASNLVVSVLSRPWQGKSAVTLTASKSKSLSGLLQTRKQRRLKKVKTVDVQLL